MAVLTQTQLEGLGIDLSEITKAFGPLEVENRVDGTIRIKNHSLKDIIAAVKFIRGTGNSTNTGKRRISFTRVIPSDANGNHGST